MKPDELHALADALEPMAKAPRFEDFDVPAFCAWVRACADAEPVARIYTDAEMVHRDERWGRVQWIEPESELAEGTLLYTHPAPAAPHHAMLDSHRRLVEQAIQDTEHPSGMSTHDGKARIDASVLRRMLSIIDSRPAPAVPQAESIDPHMIVAEDRFPDEQAAIRALGRQHD